MCESVSINTVSYDTIKVWFRKFKAENFDLEDEPRSGRPIEVDSEQLKQIIHQDRNVSSRTVADQRKEKILDRKVTCEEKWVYYNNTSRKGGWSALGESSGSVARRALTNKKVLFCIWWDCRGIICKDYLKSGHTINSAIYSTATC
ncbi:hypothetical protein AVEN_256574-1 [Araneus ventricosus]|uniref:Mos1 transposase HTH domain-containing protein n=1 Tax=Araneus ventricosus TaxID=182803 RepID=A0A4Y2IZG9_ARAVE|nr:hypothetical protein AVEN_256574-1 [Araneus ventricosus]